MLGWSTVKTHSPDKIKVKLTNTHLLLSVSVWLSLSDSERELERETAYGGTYTLAAGEVVAAEEAYEQFS